MVCGIGVDIVEVGRVGKVAERHGDRFLRRIYTPLELEKTHGNRNQYLAARFAAKEAAFKALGTGWGGGVRWVEVEVDNLASGQPVLSLHGTARDRAEAMGVERLHITISHTQEYAMAQVILEGPGLEGAGIEWRGIEGRGIERPGVERPGIEGRGPEPPEEE